jgi:hypothetical protein
MLLTETGKKVQSGPADFRLSRHLYGRASMIKTPQNYKNVTSRTNFKRLRA